MSPNSDRDVTDKLCRERLCELLKRLTQQGTSQQQAALRAGLPPQYLSDIKNGRRPMTELVARRIGQEFRIDYQWLLGLSDTIEPLVLRDAPTPTGEKSWLPVFSQPISGDPQSLTQWDGTKREISGAEATKLKLLKWPYVLKVGSDDIRGRLHLGDLVLISQTATEQSEISVIEFRKKLVLARRQSDKCWERITKGGNLPPDCLVIGHSVAILWSDLSGSTR
jgi:transcriptional regulator with XRE-family HTH domain